MPRIQTFISNDILNAINALIEKRVQEGARASDANISNMSSMLIELGLRVYNLQNEKKESPFNQMEFNKIMLEHAAKTNALCSEIVRMSMMMSEVTGNERFSQDKVFSIVKKYTKDRVDVFFKDGDENEVE